MGLLAWGLVVVFGLTLPASAQPQMPGPEPLAAQAPAPPFERRWRRGVKDLRARQRGLTDLARWPAEPTAPEPVSRKGFTEAFTELCWRQAPRNHLRKYAGWILESAAEFGVDPFLVAAVVYRFSRCRQDGKADFGIGLGRVNPRMHAAHIGKDGVYRDQVLQEGVWLPREVPMGRFKFLPYHLRRPETNLYFTAALLKVAEGQCPHNDGAFGSVPHRHFVSHYAWGDKVEGAGAEDRVLRARRRLIELYRGQRPSAMTAYEGMPLFNPLDGVPRKITSGLGADRDEGARRHRGVDFDSTTGEPVRAIADGVVTFAGIDMRRGKSQRVPASVAQRVKRSRVGAGGLMVIIEHAHGLSSAYMHLSDYTVQTGDRVEGGQQIGRVGRSGIKRSSAHLHFEIRKDDRHIDPIPLLAPYTFGPRETWWGQRAEIIEKGRRKLRRVKRWRDRQAKRARSAAEQAAQKAKAKLAESP